MDEALVIDKTTQESRIMTAADFIQKFSTAASREGLITVTPEIYAPLVLKAGKSVRPHFTRAEGFGLGGELYRDGRTREDNYRQALEDDKKILFVLDRSLVPKPRVPGSVTPTQSHNRNRFIIENEGNYYPHLIRSAEEAFNEARTIRAHCTDETLNQRVSVACLDEHITYYQFAIGRNKEKLKARENSAWHRHHELFTKGKYSIGVPRLMAFIPTDALLNARGTGAKKGNHFEYTDTSGQRRQYMSHLRFKHESVDGRADYQRFWAQASASREGIYVLASTMKLIDNEGKRQDSPWRVLQWAIDDIDRQTFQSPRQAMQKPRKTADQQRAEFYEAFTR